MGEDNVRYYIYDKIEGSYKYNEDGYLVSFTDMTLDIFLDLDCEGVDVVNTMIHKIKLDVLETTSIEDYINKLSIMKEVKSLEDDLEDKKRELQRIIKGEKLLKKMEECKISVSEKKLWKNNIFGELLLYEKGDVVVWRGKRGAILRIEKKIPHRGNIFYDSTESGWMNLNRKDLRLATKEEVERLGEKNYIMLEVK